MNLKQLNIFIFVSCAKRISSVNLILWEFIFKGNIADDTLNRSTLNFFLISLIFNSKSSFNMPPKKRKIHSISTGKQSAIMRRTPPEVEDDINNDETNENES